MSLFCLSRAPIFAQGYLQLDEPGKTAIEIVPPESGIEIVPPPPHPTPPRPIPPRPWPSRHILPAELTSLEVKVEIEGLTARTTLDQSFRNPNNMRLEGTYLFPLPPNAVLSDLSLYIDGKPVKCEVVEAQKARQIYEDIVRRARDPALLEYIGRDVVRLRIFPIEPNQVRRVKFTYGQALKREFGLTEFSYLLVTRSQTGQTIGQFSVSGGITSDQPITSVYSPTHDIEFVKKGDKTVKFSFEKENHAPSSNLKIYYAVSQKDLGAGLIAFKGKEDEEGYYMLMIAPRAEIRKERIIPKDVTFVFDTSGSMSGDKIMQAKAALKFCLNSLREGDRFNIIRFSTETEKFADALVPVSKEKLRQALEFVEGFTATGGTAIDQALREALGDRGEKDRPRTIVFLTDGKPTVGERDPDAIVRNAADRNEGSARIFTFGVDSEINTRLLDNLAEENGGASDYVTPKEDIEVKVSNFFSKVSEPILTGLTLDCGGVKVSKSYPAKLPDLFAGSQLTIVGRYKGTGKKTIVLTGNVGGEKKVFEYEVEFPETSSSADFLPRLWAIRRVGHLVDEIRKNGEDKELKDEIIRLGKKYAIATPYTSLLVVEDQPIGPGMQPAPPMRRHEIDGLSRGMIAPSGAPEQSSPRSTWFGFGGAASERAVRADSRSLATGLSEAQMARPATPTPAPLSAAEGAAAVAVAKATREMKESERASEGFDAAAKIQQVEGRTFYLRDGVWTDSEYDGKAETIKIAYGSQEYFDLLSKHPEAGKFLALGEKVILLLEGAWYQITEAKAE